MVYEGEHTLGPGLSSTEKNRELISVFELDHGSVAVSPDCCALNLRGAMLGARHITSSVDNI